MFARPRAGRHDDSVPTMIDGEMPQDSNNAEGLSRQLRRELTSRAHALKPSVQIGGRGLSDGIIAQVRQALRKHDLIKIRVQVEKGADAVQVGNDLVRQVPCKLVKRVGKILVVYAPSDESASS